MTARQAHRPASPRVAVLGCGQWGRNLVRNFHALGVLVAVCDEDAEAAIAMADQFGVPALQIAQIWADPEIAAVAVATPAQTHATLALRAIEAGKHVYVEKPLALEVSEAIRVGEAADRAGRVVMVGHLLRYHPGFQALTSLIQDGVLGRLRHLAASRFNLGRIRREEDVFWSFAPHDISMVLALAGTAPETVQATGSCCLHERTADIATAHFRFPGELDAQISVSWLHPTKQQMLTVIGESGMAVFDDLQPWHRKLLLYPHRIIWLQGRPDIIRADSVPVALEAAEPLLLECEHFLNCVATEARPRTDWREGLAVVRVLDAARRSMAASAPVTLMSPASPNVFVHPSAFVDPGCLIGARTKIWFFSHVLRGSRIGQDCVVGQNVMIGPDVSVGNRCKIQNNVSVYSGVTLEDGVFCGPSCVFTNVNNPRAEVERKEEFRPTVVGRGATIGANATIVCGHRIGRYAFVAAGAVVTGDVPAHALVAGNPARRIGWMSEAGHRLSDDLVCLRTQQRYGPDGTGGLQRVDDIREMA